MKCPICGTWTIVKEARESSIFGYRRRRECANEHKFTTQEVVVPQEILDKEKETRGRRNIKGKMVAVQAGRWEVTGVPSQTTDSKS